MFDIENYHYYNEYFRYCPFLLSNYTYSLHFERRCELYNTYNNSIYSKQYICSYNTTKDFKHTYYPKQWIDANVCVPFNKTIKNNTIINQFINEYKNEKKFYCSFVYDPKRSSYNYFKHEKYCIKRTHKYMFSFLILQFLKFVFMTWPFCISYYQDTNYRTSSNNSSEIVENDIHNEKLPNKKSINASLENKKTFEILEIKNEINLTIKVNDDDLNNSSTKIII